MQGVEFCLPTLCPSIKTPFSSYQLSGAAAIFTLVCWNRRPSAVIVQCGASGEFLKSCDWGDVQIMDWVHHFSYVMALNSNLPIHGLLKCMTQGQGSGHLSLCWHHCVCTGRVTARHMSPFWHQQGGTYESYCISRLSPFGPHGVGMTNGIWVSIFFYTWVRDYLIFLYFLEKILLTSIFIF